MLDINSNVKVNTELAISGEASPEIAEQLNQILESDNNFQGFDKVTHFTLEQWSFARENVISWYPFKANCTILELNADYGAITGCLVKKAKKVVALTETKHKAEFIAKRCNEDNLSVIAGPICTVLPKLEQKFDYALFVGEKLNSEELTAVKSVLKANGKLLIATDNRFGMKYLAGVKNPKTGQLYDLVDGYEKTYLSKLEWSNLLNKAGFEKLSFKYPYPDYKFCNQIFSDSYLPPLGSLGSNKACGIHGAIRTFSQTSLYDYFLSNGNFGEISNSLFIETGKDCNVIYTKFSKQRNVDKQIITSIYDEKGKRRVLKCPANDLATEFVLSAEKSKDLLSKQLKDFHVCNCKKLENCLEFEYLYGTPLSVLIDEAAKSGKDNLYEYLEILKKAIYSLSLNQDFVPSEDFKEFFGDKLPNQKLTATSFSFVDLIPDNIIVGKSLGVIDYEWVLPFAVPVEFVAFRALFVSNGISILSNEEKAKVYGLFGVNFELYNEFLALEEKFQQNIASEKYDINKYFFEVGKPFYDVRLVDYSSVCYLVSLKNAANNKEVWRQSFSGNFFSATVNLKGETELELNLAEENMYLSNFKLCGIRDGAREEIPFDSNAVIINGEDIYFNSKPSVKFNAASLSQIEISFTAYLWNTSLTNRVVSDYQSITDAQNKIKQAQSEIENLTKQNKALIEKLNELTEKQDRIEHRLAEKLAGPIRRIKERTK